MEIRLNELTIEELKKLPILVAEELKLRKKLDKEVVKNKVIALHKEVNSLGRPIYTANEIAQLTGAKEYFVADTIKEYKLTLEEA